MKDNYPILSQTEEQEAPWNQKARKPVEVKVCVSITLSKTITVMVDDYTAEGSTDEEGNPDMGYDFSGCDLKQAVKDQTFLPDDVFSTWTVDDFEVVLDE